MRISEVNTGMTWYLFIVMLIMLLGEVSCEKADDTAVAGYGLEYTLLPGVWDEAIPLGNGVLGALVWQDGEKLRFSLNRADLWDMRPMKNLDSQEYNFNWVVDNVKRGNNAVVQEKLRNPYLQLAAPTKIPGAAMEFDIRELGGIDLVILDLDNALCKISWKNGATLETFVHATRPEGWFRFTKVPAGFEPELISPRYKAEAKSTDTNPVAGMKLDRLGYEQGAVVRLPDSVIYRQKGWDGFEYEVVVAWEYSGSTLAGKWTISSSGQHDIAPDRVLPATAAVINGKSFTAALRSHKAWWKEFREKSAISIPDKSLERQWYLEQYKFGSAARSNAPPISLQAIWTADNGRLPPWKGDYHHDLNTEMSYWPAYSGNHLDLEEGFINWLWNHRETFKKYTRDYFGTGGLNVPGVTTLGGEPMGGAVQYAFGLTVSSWLAQNFCLHWVYSQDEMFLREKAYPWIRDVAIYLDEISVRDSNGVRKLPLSSSPEIHGHSADAWFRDMTSFDLAMVRWTYMKAAELAELTGNSEESGLWSTILAEWPELEPDSTGGLPIARDHPATESHRHFSHLAGWHPLGIIDWSGGDEERGMISSTLSNIEKAGTDMWCGYSYSWSGILYARAFMGEKAAANLRIFAENFCLPNSFHVNGDQSGKGYSKFTYRPFTLEGNFAFAAAIQEMLIQSHTGIIRLFPAIPEEWNDVSFRTLRTEGAFLVSARKAGGKVTGVEIISGRGGTCRLSNPFEPERYRIKKSRGVSVADDKGIIIIEMPANGKVKLLRTIM